MFTIKSYGFGELSALFSPDINMASASKQLKRWIVNNPKLLSAGGAAAIAGLRPR